MAVMFTECGAQRTLGGICEVWEKFVVKQLLLPPSPEISIDSSLPLMDLLILQVTASGSGSH